MNIREDVMAFVQQHKQSACTAQMLAQELNIDLNRMNELMQDLQCLVDEGKLICTKKGKYVLPETVDMMTGRVSGSKQGYAFLIAEDEKGDVFLPPEALMGAMHGDLVLIKLTESRNPTKGRRGEVVRVISRGKSKWVGTLVYQGRHMMFQPDDARVAQDIFVTNDKNMQAQVGDKVVVEIRRWAQGKNAAEGHVIEVLGRAGEPATDVLSVIREFDIPEVFPQGVTRAAAEILQTIPPEEIARREDLRALRMVTIDGEDAKDLDDAVSVERLANGRFRLGVHIADVSFYVRENKPLDREAYNRGTSVYFADRVIPMLPEALSNGICSLNAKQDRLAMSVFMDIDEKGHVIDYQVAESVICTAERMTYTDVFALLQGGTDELNARYGYLLDDFRAMHELMHLLNAQRHARGSVDFEIAESKIVLDDRGRAIDIVLRERNDAHRMIEEFMLIANETVARHLTNLDVPFLYRVHDEPDVEKIREFEAFASTFGLRIARTSKGVSPKALQALLLELAGRPEQAVVNRVLLRTMKKARYTPENIGHFGLASSCYCHFTSPIRRYPDLIVHRVLRESLQGKITQARMDELILKMPQMGESTSQTERRAMEAEWAVLDLKKAEYMSGHIGEVFEGLISGVSSFGFYVELLNTVEGLVHMRELYDDDYEYDEQKFCLMGRRKKRIFRLGDKVKIQVKSADIRRRIVDFSLV